MSITISTWRDPYDAGFSPTKPNQIEINPGLTVLVGCNGAGKTTLLLNIEEEAKKQNIPVHLFDNLRDGGYGQISAILGGYGEDGDDIVMGASLWSASEGEAIKLNIGRQSRLYKEFFKTGWFKNKNYKFASIFNDKIKENSISNERILLFDAVDSGLSVDSVVEIKALFDTILEDAKEMGIQLYLIIAANEYELARGENCFDVNAGKYIKFTDYEAYRAFIIKSRRLKEKRIEKQKIWFEKRRVKEEKMREKKIEELETKINRIKEKAGANERELTPQEKWKIDDLQREIVRVKNNR